MILLDQSRVAEFDRSGLDHARKSRRIDNHELTESVTVLDDLRQDCGKRPEMRRDERATVEAREGEQFVRARIALVFAAFEAMEFDNVFDQPNPRRQRTFCNVAAIASTSSVLLRKNR